jgi:uncharacterized membrane-anchored protein YitT (DUF2179 family)
MAFIIREKIFSKKWFISYSLVTIGSFILAAGFVLFISPYKIVPGGVYGISIVVHYLTKGLFSFWPEGIPIGLFGLILNIPLVVIGIKILGPRFGIKTIIGFVLTSVFMDLLDFMITDPDPLKLQEDLLLACLFGGLLIGFGLGLIFKSKATSGGSDIVAMILEKYTKLPLGQLISYVDAVIVLLGLVAFGDWKIPLYSWITIYVAGRVIDLTLEGTSFHKMVYIISDEYEAIRKRIIEDIKRGGTYIPGNGMFRGAEKTIIFTVLSRREVTILKDYIREIDEEAFIAVTDAKEIIGEGFKTFEK